jgi:ABC-2 type transport system permease protein
MEGEAAFMGRFMAPFILAFVFLMAVNTTSQFLMSSVVEEKENRMMEILLTSCTPLQMLWGKVLGLGLLGLTQVGLWLGAGALIISGQSEGVMDFLSGVRFTPDIIILGLLYLVLGYFFFSGVMAGVGASVTAEREGQQFAGFFTILTILPMALLITFMEDPNGPLPVFFSIFPLTSPVGMLMRMPMTTVPVWEIIVSVALLAVTVVATVWLAARVFRLGLLMYGKRLTAREIIAALRQGGQTMVSAAQSREGV